MDVLEAGGSTAIESPTDTAPEHLEARLRNMATSLGHDALVGVLTQIHDGVDLAVWAEVESRTPDLAALVIRA